MTKLQRSRRTVLGSLGASLLMTGSRTALAAPVTLEALKKAGEVRVGCEAAYVPFTYRDTAGKIIGFDVDFATRMFSSSTPNGPASSRRCMRAASTWSPP